ncbi:MAG TPA: hypothetical protein DHV62_08340 [Elusimicrobia bacterium]|jgi:hypothetical protein|nr:hypothetical protein [Elusimicrobiota bacterium]
MKLPEHIGISFSLSTISFALTKNYLFALSSFLSGVFIDLDHFFDYFKSEGIKFDLHDFFHRCENYRIKKFYLLLHSYEIILLFGLIVSLTSYNSLTLGIFLGFSQHLLLDQISNGAHPLGYFFIYRWLNGFSSEYVFNNYDAR